MKLKWLEKLRSLPTRTRQGIIIGVVLFLFLIAVGTYGFWGTLPKNIGSSSFIEGISNVLSNIQPPEADNGLKEIQNQLSALANEADKTNKSALETSYAANTVLLPNKQETSKVTVTLNKVLLDPSATVLWLTIQNASTDSVTVDPKTSFEIHVGEKTYLPRAVANLAGAQDLFTKDGFTEIFATQQIAAGKTIKGFIRFDALPTTLTAKLNLKSFLAETARTKWDYAFDLNLTKPVTQKAENNTGAAQNITIQNNATSNKATQPQLPQE